MLDWGEVFLHLFKMFRLLTVLGNLTSHLVWWSSTETRTVAFMWLSAGFVTAAIEASYCPRVAVPLLVLLVVPRITLLNDTVGVLVSVVSLVLALAGGYLLHQGGTWILRAAVVAALLLRWGSTKTENFECLWWQCVVMYFPFFLPGGPMVLCFAWSLAKIRSVSADMRSLHLVAEEELQAISEAAAGIQADSKCGVLRRQEFCVHATLFLQRLTGSSWRSWWWWMSPIVETSVGSAKWRRFSDEAASRAPTRYPSFSAAIDIPRLKPDGVRMWLKEHSVKPEICRSVAISRSRIRKTPRVFYFHPNSEEEFAALEKLSVLTIDSVPGVRDVPVGNSWIWAV